MLGMGRSRHDKEAFEALVQAVVEYVYYIPRCAAGHDSVPMMKTGWDGPEEARVAHWLCPMCQRRVDIHHDENQYVTAVIECT